MQSQKQDVLEHPHFVALEIDISNSGAIFATVKLVSGKAKELPYLSNVKCWDVSIVEIQQVSTITLKSIPPRAMFCKIKNGNLLIVESEYS